MKNNIIILVVALIAVGSWFLLRPLPSVDDVTTEEVGDPSADPVTKKRKTNHRRTFLETPAVMRAALGSADASAATNSVSTNAPVATLPGVIPDEYIMSFYSEADRDEFIRIAKSMGAEIFGSMKLGNSIRLKADEETLRKLKSEAPMSVDFTNNREMNNPELPILDPEAPQGTYNVFGNGVLAWMGIGDNSDWGRGVKVAVLDSGINMHSALAKANIVRLDLVGGNGLDPSTTGAHGTSVASLIAGNNEFMRGVSPAADILGIRVAGENGQGDLFTVAQGIITAVDSGANIINVSMGTRSDSYLLRDAVNYAAEHGVLVVAATGNDSSYGVSFPAGYESVVAVPAVDAAGRHMYFSNRGEAVDIAGPGLGVNAAGVGDTMDSFSGTSAASPLISGAIAAIMSETPGLIAADALAILIYYSDDAGKPGPDEELGAGLPNMRRVMERDTKGIYDIAVNTPYLTTIEPGGDVELVVTLQNRGTENISRVELNVNIDDARYSTFFQNIVVSQSVNENFRIPASSLNAAGNIAVTADATIVGATDTYPNNNSMRINVFFEPKKAE